MAKRVIEWIVFFRPRFRVPSIFTDSSVSPSSVEIGQTTTFFVLCLPRAAGIYAARVKKHTRLMLTFPHIGTPSAGINVVIGFAETF